EGASVAFRELGERPGASTRGRARPKVLSDVALGHFCPERFWRVLGSVCPGAVVDESPGPAWPPGVEDHAARLHGQGPGLDVDAIWAEDQVGPAGGRRGRDDDS